MGEMNRVAVLLVLFSLPLGTTWAQDQGKPSAFVDSDPMGARILLDGQLLPVRTPALLRGVTPGPHQLKLWHEGFQQRELMIDLVPGKVPAVSATLLPESVVLAFPENTQVTDASGLHSTTGNQFRYPNGRYDLSSGATVGLKPVFPDAELLAVAGWGAVLLSTAAVLSIAADSYQTSSGWMNHPSELSLGLSISVFLELPWYGALLQRKKTFDATEAPRISPVPEHLAEAVVVFHAGETALEAGDLSAAEPFLTRVVKEFPESNLVPGAWFRLARIHLVTGRRELALGEYRLVAETYPQAESYDRARKALADLYEANGEKSKAVENLDAMVLSDGFFDPADIAAQKARLTAPPEAPHAP